MMRGRLLVIDDDIELTALMREYFGRHGFDVEAVHDGGRGLARALEQDFDAIVLDVMLPELDGFEVLRHVRRLRDTPVIMLTARTESADKILGLNTGADDYLPKPFGPDELLARVRAVLRRTRHATPIPLGPVAVTGLHLDPATRQAVNGSTRLDLTAVEFDILELLVRAVGRAVSRDALSAVVHQRPANPFERSLDVHVSRLRRKLDGSGIAIKAVRGVGYQLVLGEAAP